MGSEQHYSLRWNDYTVKIVTAFQSLRDEEDFVDVTVACDGHSYSAHKMVLSACSPYFRALLRANPCQHPIVILKDVGHVELERLLEFMYNGEVSIAQDQLAAFLRTAENLKIRGLAGSSDDMDQLGLQRPDVSYSYSSCSVGGGGGGGGAGGTSGRSSPSAGYAPSQGSKDEDVGGDGTGGYHARAESPPSKRRKRPSAPAAGHADSNTATHTSEGVVGEASVEVETGGSVSGAMGGEDDVRLDRRELKSEPGDVMADVYSETSELTDPASHEALDPRQPVLYPLALPGPSGAAGNQDTIGPHEPGAGALVVAWATMVEEGTGGGGGLGKKPLALADSFDATSGECAMMTGTNSSGGRLYPCPDCEKVFRHPRSYYQHQHVHRGTHSCPGCGKLFSRRWDLLRHLNKNKYGCPARWREGSRHPPYHNSLSLSALASAAAVAASTQEGLLPPEPPDPQSLHQPVSWTIPSVTAGGVSGRTHSSSSSSSGSNGEPRPPEPPTASRTSP